MTRKLPPAMIAAASSAIALGVACNAIVGNGDIRFSVEAGSPDATTGAEASVESGTTLDAGVDETSVEGIDADAAPEAAADAAFSCEAGTKLCAGSCVDFDDPGYGCGPTHCSPCELANAVAGCGLADGGVDGGPLTCSVALCKPFHADCNGTPLDGCEIDTRDLYNCGTCGHDCTNLPQVAGNVGCTNGVCTFDSTSCAPTFGICSSNPDDGCDTEFSLAAHCGSCATVCSGGFPDCSKTTSTSQPFACTSGCAPGLSLCGASCVDEQTDPSHCGGCNTQCPAVTGGTSTCSAGGVCGFTCNANDHRCGTGSSASCAANNDPNNCGVGAACGTCAAPANATPTCTGGTTCGYTCLPGAHACNNACVLNSDPNNCGSSCGTNCPGPTQGSGVASCDGNVCTIDCAEGLTLCGGFACVNTQTDEGNCGSCGNTCGAGQMCVSGQCLCNAASCPGGCCDGTGTCQATGSSACGSNGMSCFPGCPATVPNLVLWLVGDTYTSGATVWRDQSGHANATCSFPNCPSVSAAALNGHSVVSFDGSRYFALGDPNGLYQTTAFTVIVVAAPDPGAPSNAVMIAFSDGAAGDALSLQRSDGDPDLMMQLLPGFASNALIVPGAWAGASETIAGTVSGAGASLAVGSSPNTGAIGTPASVDYTSSYLGTDPATQTANYVGQIAEVLVFDTVLSPGSIASIKSYLSMRYSLP